MDRFGSLTVLHLPNKNYRRVGKKGRLGGNREDAPENEFGDGKTEFQGPDSRLVTAMELHVEMEKHFPSSQRRDRRDNDNTYRGIITLVNEVDPVPFFRGKERHAQLMETRMKAYEEYVRRGGILSKEDMEGASRHAFLDIEEE